MDPLADKIFVTGTMLMAVEYRIIPAWIAIAVLFREFMVTGLRTLAAKKQVVISADRWGKLKTALQMTMLGIAGIAWAIDGGAAYLRSASWAGIRIWYVWMAFMTGIVLVSSILAYPEITYSDGAALTKVAFSKIPYIGAPILTFGIITFAFSTILGWSYYGEKAIQYIAGRKTIYVFRGLWIVAAYLGANIDLALVWSMADCANALMAFPNLISLLLLSKVIARETNKYLWKNRLDEYSTSEPPTIDD
jgi:hypothetical protein